MYTSLHFINKLTMYYESYILSCFLHKFTTNLSFTYQKHVCNFTMLYTSCIKYIQNWKSSQIFFFYNCCTKSIFSVSQIGNKFIANSYKFITQWLLWVYTLYDEASLYKISKAFARGNESLPFKDNTAYNYVENIPSDFILNCCSKY